MRGIRQPFPIKLLYAASAPMIMTSVLLYNINFVILIIARQLGSNFFVALLGRWEDVEQVGFTAPTGGLVYYLNPVGSVFDIVRDPIHVVVHTLFVVGCCSVFGKIWVEINGTGARDLAR